MRFRPANISLINRRHYLPRLLLTLSSKRQIQKPPQRFADVDSGLDGSYSRTAFTTCSYVDFLLTRLYS